MSKKASNSTTHEIERIASLMDNDDKDMAAMLNRPKFFATDKKASEIPDDLWEKLEAVRPAHIMTEEDYLEAATDRVNDRNEPTVSKQEGKDLIVWLLAPGENDKRKSYIKKIFQQRCPHLLRKLRFVTVGTPKNKITKPRTKQTIQPSDNYQELFSHALSSYIPRASVFVINHFDVLVCLLHGSTGHGNKKTLAAFRGSIYLNEFFAGIPAIVIEDAFKCYAPNFNRLTGKDEVSKTQSCQFFEYDIDKLQRIYKDPRCCTNTFDERFEVLSLGGRAISAVAGPTDKLVNSSWYNTYRFHQWLSQQCLLALDFETSMGHITCISVTGISNNDKSTMKTWLVAHIAPIAQDNEYVGFGAFKAVLDAILNHHAPKIWHNGNYDNHYSMLYNMPSAGLNYDTMLMWHSYRARMPQSLATVASIFCDDYYFWKDEIKGGSGEKKTQVKYAVPVTRQGLMIYWRYAGLDTHMCMTAFLKLIELVNGNSWAGYNYAKEYALMRGPLFETNFKGMKMDTPELHRLLAGHRKKSSEALVDLQKASNHVVKTDTDTEVVNWLYHTLGANPPPKKPNRKTSFSVDQKQLILVAEQHPIFDKAIEYIRAHREPKKQIEMYQSLKPHHGRMTYGYGLAPYTGRLNCRGSSFWKGSNVQNISAKMRSFMTADDGKVLLDIDYSQADLYHFAVACGDKNMMKNVFDDRDTHTVHVETILQLPYEEGMRLRKSDDEAENAIMNHPITGLRQIIKKLTHGGNYGMTAHTVYVNAGKEALAAAAVALGLDPSTWSREDYYQFCDFVMIPYFEEYSQQKPWRKDILQQCIDNEGLVTCFGGLTVYFDDYKRRGEHASLTRALLAFYGQGGTAGMINEAMIRMYYGNLDQVGKPHVAVADDNSTFMREHNIDLLLQTHDSLTYQVPVEVLKERTLIDYILTMMELQCNFNGVNYKVPCEVNVGHRWSKKMPEIKPNHTNAELVINLLNNYSDEGLLTHG